jgi:hypothetical protein
MLPVAWVHRIGRDTGLPIADVQRAAELLGMACCSCRASIGGVEIVTQEVIPPVSTRRGGWRGTGKQWQRTGR